MEILKYEIPGHVRSVCVMGTRNNVTVRQENALTARTMLQASTVRDVRMDGLEMLLHRDVNVSVFFFCFWAVKKSLCEQDEVYIILYQLLMMVDASGTQTCVHPNVTPPRFITELRMPK